MQFLHRSSFWQCAVKECHVYIGLRIVRDQGWFFWLGGRQLYSSANSSHHCLTFGAVTHGISTKVYRNTIKRKNPREYFIFGLARCRKGWCRTLHSVRGTRCVSVTPAHLICSSERLHEKIFCITYFLYMQTILFQPLNHLSADWLQMACQLVCPPSPPAHYAKMPSMNTRNCQKSVWKQCLEENPDIWYKEGEGVTELESDWQVNIVKFARAHGIST
jgi:hypothetical protein